MSSCCTTTPLAPCCGSPDSSPGNSGNALLWLRLGLATLVSAQTMAFGLAVNLSPPSGSTRLIIHGILAGSVLLVFFLVGLPIVRESWRLFLHRRIGLEHLFLAGITGAFLASIHSTLSGQGSVFYEVVAILLAIYTLGSLLSQRRRQAALQSGEALRREFEFCEVLLPDGETERLPIRDVKPGMRLQVRAGEGIPVDGVIESGSAYIHETPLTGEPFPVIKREGDRVLAGSRSVDRTLVITAESIGENRRLDQLLRSIQEARETQSGLQREADRLVSWFLPVVLGISLVTFIAWTLQTNWIIGLFNALAVLVVACPCAMGLATPIGIWSALEALARRGIVAHSGDFIERLARVDTVVFDKTGTLSEEDLAVVDFLSLPGLNRPDLQASLAAVQRESNHPVARAFQCWSDPGNHSRLVSEITLLPGTGISAMVSGSASSPEHLEIGNDQLLSPGDRAELQKILGVAASAPAATRDFYIRQNGRLVAVARLRENLRSSARACLDQLKSLGLRVEIMTGDQASGAAAVGLGEAQSGLLPEDKIRLVRNLAKAGHRVLFVGDGINDSGAMSHAHASIALASGAQLTRENAQAQLFGNNLGAIPESLLITRRVLLGIRQNMNFAVFYNLIGMGLAASGIIHPVLAALLMLFSSSLVTWRALRFAEKLRSNSLRPLASLPSSESWMDEKMSGLAALPRHFFKRDSLPRLSWIPLVLGAGIALQGPMLAYMGALPMGYTLLLSLATILLGCWIAQALPKWKQAPTLNLVVGMLALGNLGMLLGWSAHAGFGAVIRDGVCLCGCPKSALGQGLVGFSWMQAGMLLSSIPALFVANPLPSATSPNRQRLSFLGHAGACLIGMLAGMEFASYVMSLIPVGGDSAQAQFFLTFLAMTCGMVFGMIAACRLYLQWLKRI